MTEKVKDFIKDHKKTILIGVGVVTGLTLGIYGLNKSLNSGRKIARLEKSLKACPPYDDVSAEMMRSARKAYPGMHMTHGFILNDPVSADDLGILGKMLIEDGDKNQTFTHFIAIGEQTVEDMTHKK